MKFIIVLIAFVGVSMAAPKPRTLQDDFKDILALFPVEDMRAICRDHLDNDPEFQQIVAYLQGPQWHALVDAVRENPIYQDFKAYLIEAGIDVDGIAQWIHDLIEGAQPGSKVSTRGMREFVDEMHAVIPRMKILALVNEKLETSADFQELYKKISSDRARILFEEVRGMDEVQRIAAILNGWGLELQRLVDAIYMFLGWN